MDLLRRSGHNFFNNIGLGLLQDGVAYTGGREVVVADLDLPFGDYF